MRRARSHTPLSLLIVCLLCCFLHYGPTTPSSYDASVVAGACQDIHYISGPADCFIVVLKSLSRIFHYFRFESFWWRTLPGMGRSRLQVSPRGVNTLLYCK